MVVLIVYHDADELENVTVTNVSMALFKHGGFLFCFFFLDQFPKKIKAYVIVLSESQTSYSCGYIS